MSRAPRGAADNIRVAQAHTPTRRYTLLDIPGGPRSVKAALRGAAVAQAAVVVVSASRGPQAQTRDHVFAAVAGGLSPLVILINDDSESAGVDSGELIDACALMVRGVINDLGEAGDDVAVISGAVTDSAVAAAVIDALDAAVVPAADDSAGVVMRVLFDHGGRSRARGRSDEAVASGRLLTGTLHLGDRVRVVGLRHPLVGAHSVPPGSSVPPGAPSGSAVPPGAPSGSTALARVDRLEVQGEAHDVVRAGEQLGVQLYFEGPAPIVDRQSVVIVGEHVEPAHALRARLRLRPQAIGGRHRPLRAGFVCLAWFGASSVLCTIIPVGESDSDVVVDPDATFDAVVVMSGGPAHASYVCVGDGICLSGDGGLIASGSVSAVVDDAPFRERLRALRGARAGSRRAQRQRPLVPA